MKKLYLMLSMLFAFGMAANAVPAKKLQKVITLANAHRCRWSCVVTSI